MLPSLVAQEIREGLRPFLLTGFEPSNAGFRGLVQRFLEQPGGLDKGPYLSIGLPFRRGTAARDFYPGFATEYGRNRVVLSKCGIDIRGRSRKLMVNYRTTEEISRSAVALLEGQSVDDLDGGEDTQRGYRSLTHGARPEHRPCAGASEQADAIRDLVQVAIGNGTPPAAICVVARSNRELDDLEGRLTALGLRCQRIRTDQRDAGDPAAVRLATMHRVKGLEFDCMIVASVNADLVPPQAAFDSADPVERALTELEERSLLYVALTRARREAHLLSYGVPSRYLFVRK